MFKQLISTKSALLMLCAVAMIAATGCSKDDDESTNNNSTEVQVDSDYGTVGKDEFVATGGYKNVLPFTATILGSVNKMFSGAYIGLGVEIVPGSPSFSSSRCQRVAGSGVMGDRFEIELMDGDRGLLEANTTYYYRTYVNMAGMMYYGQTRTLTTVEPTITESGAVDLGVSSKWAACNLGADSPEKAGTLKGMFNYNGEYENWNHDDVWTLTLPSGTIPLRKPKSRCYGDWSGDKHWDPATHTLGSKWRTPTWDDWAELLYECHWTAMTHNGVAGYAVSNGDGSKSIFIPFVLPKNYANSWRLRCIDISDTSIGNPESDDALESIWENNSVTCYLTTNRELMDHIDLFFELTETDPESHLTPSGKHGADILSEIYDSTVDMMNIHRNNVEECSLHEVHRGYSYLFPLRPVMSK